MPVRSDSWYESLLARCVFPSLERAWLARCPAGADSLALLTLASAAGFETHAFHVDHGLRVGSEREADIVEAAARQLALEFTSLSVSVMPGPNLEARARAARYEALPAGVATGHTADDQAETILLALASRQRLAGLGGMTPSAQRPILGLRRHETEAVCRRVGLSRSTTQPIEIRPSPQPSPA